MHRSKRFFWSVSHFTQDTQADGHRERRTVCPWGFAGTTWLDGNKMRKTGSEILFQSQERHPSSRFLLPYQTRCKHTHTHGVALIYSIMHKHVQTINKALINTRDALLPSTELLYCNISGYMLYCSYVFSKAWVYFVHTSDCSHR